MTVYTNNLDMGTGEGVAITSGSSGTSAATGQTPFSAVNLVAAGTCTFSATGKAHGAYGMRIQAGPTDTVKAYWNITASGVMSARIYFTLNAAPSASAQEIVWVLDSAFAAFLKVLINASGQVYLFNPGTNTILKTWATVPTVGQQYCLKMQVQPGAGTTDGFVAAQIFVGDTTTRLDTDYTASNLNIGTLQIGRFQWSKAVSSGTLDITFDDPYVDNTTITPVPQWAVAAPNAAPTISAGGTQTVQAGSSVTFTANASDSDGTISTLTGAITGPVTPALSGSATGLGTASASLSQTATLSTVGKYTWTATVTDNDGATAPATSIAYVYAASDTSTDATAAVLGTSTVVGAASAIAAITGTAAPATKYLEGVAGGGAFGDITLGPMGPGALKVYVEGYYNAGALTRTAKIYKGATLVYTDTWPLTSADAEHPVTVDSAGLALIPAASDRQALILRVTDA